MLWVHAGSALLSRCVAAGAESWRMEGRSGTGTKGAGQGEGMGMTDQVGGWHYRGRGRSPGPHEFVSRFPAPVAKGSPPRCSPPPRFSPLPPPGGGAAGRAAHQAAVAAASRRAAIAAARTAAARRAGGGGAVETIQAPPRPATIPFSAAAQAAPPPLAVDAAAPSFARGHSAAPARRSRIERRAPDWATVRAGTVSHVYSASLVAVAG